MKNNIFELFWIAFKLGLTSFGGPPAHLGFFYREYVLKRKWLTDEQFAEYVALANFLPGPSSSQVGMAIGLQRAGIIGSIVAWAAFTLPSFLVMMIAASLLHAYVELVTTWLHGVVVATCALVAHSIWEMAKKSITNRKEFMFTLVATGVLFVYTNSWMLLVTISIAALVGTFIFKRSPSTVSASRLVDHPKLFMRTIVPFTLFVVLLGWSLLHPEQLFAMMYRSGTFIFGGGHALLPFMYQEFVETHTIDATIFMQGYSMAQSIPGPMFTFATFLGQLVDGTLGALVSTIAIFLPGYLLLLSVLPYWHILRNQRGVQSALKGMTLAVIGILIHVWSTSLFVFSVKSGFDILFFLTLFVLLIFKRIPVWILLLIGLIFSSLVQLI